MWQSVFFNFQNGWKSLLEGIESLIEYGSPFPTVRVGWDARLGGQLNHIVDDDEESTTSPRACVRVWPVQGGGKRVWSPLFIEIPIACFAFVYEYFRGLRPNGWPSRHLGRYSIYT